METDNGGFKCCLLVHENDTLTYVIVRLAVKLTLASDDVIHALVKIKERQVALAF